MMRRGLLAAAIMLASAPATAQIDNSALECASSGATFFPRGDHWAVVPGMTGPTEIVYRQNITGLDDVDSRLAGTFAEHESINRAIGAWTTQQFCSGEYPNLYVLDGLNLMLADWPTRDRGDTYDMNDNLMAVENVVYFVVNSANWAADSQTVALTTNIFIPDTGIIITGDMEFNAVDYQWRARENGGTEFGCASGGGNCYDVETVALHEGGHLIGFNHVNCADAAMFPHGSGTLQRTSLSTHEITGTCTIYPPRPASPPTPRVFGEQCTNDTDCPDNLCITPVGLEGSGWGWCSKTCTSSTTCGTGFICAQQAGGSIQFCKPGVNDTGGSTTGGGGQGTPVADPTTGVSSDFCAPCTAGTQCASGICVNDGTPGSDSICTQTCVAGSLPTGDTPGAACPTGFDCNNVQGTDWSVCWPQNPGACQGSFGEPINSLCFIQGGGTTPDQFAACAQGLLCFGFKPKCGGQVGACVTYCNATDVRCPDPNQRCCYGVDNNGSCIENPSQFYQHGGCFDIREEGQYCVAAEQSICERGTICETFTDPTNARCYKTCASQNDCGSGTECQGAADGCSNPFQVCCESEDLPGTCTPGMPPAKWDIGVRCDVNEDCDSNLCLRFNNDTACSRTCNPVTGVGCPDDNADVNGDGVGDGGFVCRLISGGGKCWPRIGPVEPPPEPDADGPPLPEGCCAAVGGPGEPGEKAVNFLVWLPFVVGWMRKRRRARAPTA